MSPTPLGYCNDKVNIINIMLRGKEIIITYVSKHARTAAASERKPLTYFGVKQVPQGNQPKG
jgi:hypothetical protein